MVPPCPPPLGMKETEAQGSDTAGRKATASQEGTELRRHRIPDPKLTLYSRLPFRAEIRKAVHRVVGETGRKGGGILYSYIYI